MGGQGSAGQVLAETVVQILSQAAAFAIGHSRDLLIEAVALGDFAFQGRCSLAHALIQFPQHRSQLRQNNGEDQV